jgi:tripartite-type tricarboxylate transporter receptor subunit TctC
MGGEVSWTLNGLLATLPHIKSGKLRVLAVTGLNRAEALPDVPTLDETILPGFLSGSWQGLLAPAGTPNITVAKAV